MCSFWATNSNVWLSLVWPPICIFKQFLLQTKLCVFVPVSFCSASLLVIQYHKLCGTCTTNYPFPITSVGTGWATMWPATHCSWAMWTYHLCCPKVSGHVVVVGSSLKLTPCPCSIDPDGGVYTCTATNDVASVSHSARINVYGKPVMRKMPNVTAVAGETISITCPVGGYPIDVITWERGRGTLRVPQVLINLLLQMAYVFHIIIVKKSSPMVPFKSTSLNVSPTKVSMFAWPVPVAGTIWFLVCWWGVTTICCCDPVPKHRSHWKYSVSCKLSAWKT